jgi:hypothetical protein
LKRSRPKIEHRQYCNGAAPGNRPLGAPLGLDPLGGSIYVRIGNSWAICEESTGEYSASVFIPSQVDPPLRLVDLRGRSNFVDRMALAHYCIDERRGRDCVH